MAGPAIQNSIDWGSPRFWTGVIRGIPLEIDVHGDEFLPPKDVGAYKISFDRFIADNPAAQFVAPGAESPTIPRQMLASAWANASFLRAKMRLNELDMMQLRAFGDAPPSSPGGLMARTARATLQTTAERVKQSVVTRREWFQMNALAGSVTVNDPSGVQFILTFPVRTYVPGTLWDVVATADPIVDVNAWMHQNPSVTWTRMLTSRKVIYNLLRNATLRNTLYRGQSGLAGQTQIVGRQALTQLFSGELGLEIIEYNTVYTTYTDTGVGYTIASAPILPDNIIILLPRAAPGYTMESPSPYNDWQSGLFGWAEDPFAPGARKDPPNWELGAGWYGAPVLENPEQICVVTVAA